MFAALVIVGGLLGLVFFDPVGKEGGEVAGEAFSPQENFKTLLEPITTEPSWLSIPQLELTEVEVLPVGVTEDGKMEIPADFNQVGWLRHSTPLGGYGNLVLAGHYDDSRGQPAVFYRLGTLPVGARIILGGESGIPILFVVTEVLPIRPDEAGVVEAFRSFDEPTLTLITCGGIWDSVAGSYNQRVLVRAKRAEVW